MRRGKKFIVSAVLASVVLVGSIGGVVFANGDANGNEPGALFEGLWDRVCEIYQEKTGVAIDQEVLKDSFAQAQREMREAAMETRLQYLVEQDQITQGEADQYLEWWQSRPDVAVRPGFGGHGGLRGWGGLRAPPPAE